MAVKMWDFIAPEVSLLVYLVYDPDEDVSDMDKYEVSLRKASPSVQVRRVQTGDMDCVLKSQTVRMWAFQEQIIQACFLGN